MGKKIKLLEINRVERVEGEREQDEGSGTEGARTTKHGKLEAKQHGEEGEEMLVELGGGEGAGRGGPRGGEQ